MATVINPAEREVQWAKRRHSSITFDPILPLAPFLIVERTTLGVTAAGSSYAPVGKLRSFR